MRKFFKFLGLRRWMIITPNLRMQAAEGVLALLDHLCMREWHDMHSRLGVQQMHHEGLVGVKYHYPRRETIKVAYEYGVESLLEVLCSPELLGINVLCWDRIPGYTLNGRDMYGNQHQYRLLPTNDFIALRMELDVLHVYGTIPEGVGFPL